LLSKTSKRTLDSEQGKIALEASKEWSRWVVSAWYLGGKEQGKLDHLFPIGFQRKFTFFETKQLKMLPKCFE